MLTIPIVVTDLGAAVCAGLICAPLVAVIDEAITLSAAGKKDLWAAMRSKLANIAKAPVKFFSSASFLWISRSRPHRPPSDPAVAPFICVVGV
jgi:hypothetical protein